MMTWLMAMLAVVGLVAATYWVVVAIMRWPSLWPRLKQASAIVVAAWGWVAIQTARTLYRWAGREFPLCEEGETQPAAEPVAQEDEEKDPPSPVPQALVVPRPAKKKEKDPPSPVPQALVVPRPVKTEKDPPSPVPQALVVPRPAKKKEKDPPSPVPQALVVPRPVKTEKDPPSPVPQALVVPRPAKTEV